MNTLLLLLGCIIGKVTATPLLAMGAMSAMSAPGGPMGMISGMTGGLTNMIPKSHKDRRRKQDTNAPCESSNPLDTTDDDCYTARWNLMVSYFPAHMNLQQVDGQIVQTMAEMTTMWQIILTNLSTSSTMINGTGGASSTDGLIAESLVLAAALGTLQNISAQTVQMMEAARVNFTQTANDDLRSLKDNLNNAFDSETNLTNVATDSQEASVEANADRMNNLATSALRDAVNTVVGGQNDTVDLLRQSGGSFMSTQNAFVSNTTSIVASMRALGSAVNDASSDIDSEANGWNADVTGTEIGDAVDLVETNTTGDINTRLQMTLTQLEAESSTANEGLLSDFNNQLNSTYVAISTAASNSADSADKAVQTTLSDGVDAIINQASANVTAQLDLVQSGMQNKTSDEVNSSADIASMATNIDDQADVSTIKSTTNDISTDAENQFSAQQKTARTFLASSQGNQGIQSLLDALNEAQSESQSGLSGSEGDYGSLLASLMAQVGTSGGASSTLLSNMASKISTGQSSALAQIKAQGSLAQSQIQASTLTGNVSDTGVAIDASAASARQLFLSSQASVSSGLFTGGSAVNEAMGAVMSNSSGVVTGTKDQLRSAALAGLSHVQSLGTSAQWLSQTMGGVDSAKKTSLGLAQTTSDSAETLSDGLGTADDLVATGFSKTIAQKIQLANQTAGGLNPQALFAKLASDNSKAVSQRQVTHDALVQQFEASGARSLYVANNAAATTSHMKGMMTNALPTDRVKSEFGSQLGAVLNGPGFSAWSNASANISLVEAQEFVTQYLAQRTTDVSGNPELQNLQDSADSDSNMLNKLTLQLAQLGSGEARIGSQLQAVPFGTLGSDFDRIRSDFQTAKSLEMTRLVNFTAKVERAIAKVPSELNLTHILDLQAAGSRALNAEQQKGAAGGIDVLGRMQAVQSNAANEASGISSKLINRNLTGAVHSGMTAVSNALNTMGAVGSTTDVDQVNRSTAMISADLGLLVNSTTGALSAALAQAGLAGALDFAGSRKRTGGSTNRTGAGLIGTVRVMQGTHNRSEADWQMVSQIQHSLGDGVDRSADWIDAETDRLSGLSSLMTSDDVGSTQIFFTRIALQTLLRLWNELAAHSSETVFGLNRREEEYLATLESEVKAGLRADESQINAARGKVGKLNNLILASNSSLTEWDTQFIAALGSSDAEPVKTAGLSRQIEDVPNFYYEFQANQTSLIQKIMDDFRAKSGNLLL